MSDNKEDEAVTTTTTESPKMSGQDDDKTSREEKSTKTTNSIVAPSTSSTTTTTTAASGGKRNFLEVNSLDKYKNLLLKPVETKRLKPSETLSKVRDFLPLLKESTNKLLEEFKDKPDELNIENVNDDEEHIEMNLALLPEDDDSSTSDDDDDDDEDDDDDSQDSNDDDEESTEDDEEEEEEQDDSSSNSIDELQLGFKVKNPTKIKKLKLTRDSKATKRPLIEETTAPDEQQEQTANKNSSQ
jgi:hypothetical protein